MGMGHAGVGFSRNGFTELLSGALHSLGSIGFGRQLVYVYAKNDSGITLIFCKHMSRCWKLSGEFPSGHHWPNSRRWQKSHRPSFSRKIPIHWQKRH